MYYDEDEDLEDLEDEDFDYDKSDDRTAMTCPDCGSDAEFGDNGISCPNERCPNYDPYYDPD